MLKAFLTQLTEGRSEDTVDEVKYRVENCLIQIHPGVEQEFTR